MLNNYRFLEDRHIHQLCVNGEWKNLSGTSSVVGVLNKPGLVFWASGKALEPLGWTPTKTKKEERLEKAFEGWESIGNLIGETEYLALLDKCYRNHKDSLEKSADKGIDLHAELERFIKCEMGNEDEIMVEDSPSDFDPKIQPFIKWSKENVKKFLWSEAHCYSETLWTGGICDAGALLNDGTIALIDFKSSKEAYLGHFIQCAGYDIALSESGLLDKDGNKIKDLGSELGYISKYIIFPFGAKTLEPWENKLPIEEYKKGFESAVQLYRLMKKED